MSESNFRKAVDSIKNSDKLDSSPSEAIAPKATEQLTEPKKRGRPAIGKRSNDDWVGRTYYVKRETDLDIEDELVNLKRQGIEIDKSELVDLLLSAWVKWRNGENLESHIIDITPRRKGKSPKS
jgi:hypothetical protein